MARIKLHSLLTNGQTGDLIDNIWAGSPSENAKRPYLVWFNDFSVVGNPLSGPPCTIRRAFVVIVWSDSYSFLRQVESAIIDDVSPVGDVTDISDGWDADIKAYYLRVSLNIFDT